MKVLNLFIFLNFYLMSSFLLHDLIGISRSIYFSYLLLYYDSIIAWNLRISHKTFFSFHLTLLKCLYSRCPFLVPPLVIHCGFVCVVVVVQFFWFVCFLELLISLIEMTYRASGHWGCRQHDGLGATQPGGIISTQSPSEIGRSQCPHPSAMASQT